MILWMTLIGTSSIVVGLFAGVMLSVYNSSILTITPSNIKYFKTVVNIKENKRV